MCSTCKSHVLHVKVISCLLGKSERARERESERVRERESETARQRERVLTDGVSIVSQNS